jgi:hypothetical protein
MMEEGNNSDSNNNNSNSSTILEEEPPPFAQSSSSSLPKSEPKAEEEVSARMASADRGTLQQQAEKPRLVRVKRAREQAPIDTLCKTRKDKITLFFFFFFFFLVTVCSFSSVFFLNAQNQYQKQLCGFHRGMVLHFCWSVFCTTLHRLPSSLQWQLQQSLIVEQGFVFPFWT